MSTTSTLPCRHVAVRMRTCFASKSPGVRRWCVGRSPVRYHGATARKSFTIEPAAARLPRGGEHHGARHVLTVGRHGAVDRRQTKRAGRAVEDRAEDARVVGLGNAHPLDRRRSVRSGSCSRSPRGRRSPRSAGTASRLCPGSESPSPASPRSAMSSSSRADAARDPSDVLALDASGRCPWPRGRPFSQRWSTGSARAEHQRRR